MTERDKTRYTPSRLQAVNVQALKDDFLNFKPSEPVTNDACANQDRELLTIFKAKEGVKQIALFRPVKDSNSKSHYPELTALEQALNLYKEHKLENANDSCELLLIPIVQTRWFRKHFTTLVLEFSESGGFKNTCHYDSKGFFSRLYPLNYIRKAVSSLIGSGFPMEKKYLGHQGFFNNYDCGRFVHEYIKYAAQEFAVQGLPKITKDIFQKLKETLLELFNTQKTLFDKFISQNAFQNKHQFDLIYEKVKSVDEVEESTSKGTSKPKKEDENLAQPDSNHTNLFENGISGAIESLNAGGLGTGPFDSTLLR